jgi:hypothetical protein
MENKSLFMPMNIFRKVAKMGADENLQFFSKGKRPIAFTELGIVYASANYTEKGETFIMIHQGGTHNGMDKSELKGSLWAVNSDLKLVVPSEFRKAEKPARKGK